jgi:hypothetical protein
MTSMPEPDHRRADDPALVDARVDALAGEVVASYVAGLTPEEIAEIYVLPLSAVRDVLETSGAKPPAPKAKSFRLLRRGRRDGAA